MKRLLLALAGSALLLSLVGCQSESVSHETAESVEDRAVARWESLLEKDYERAWEFNSPASRDVVPLADFVLDQRSRPFEFQDATLTQVDCEIDSCRVTFQLSYRMLAGPTGIRGMSLSTRVTETWVNVDGIWWFVKG